MARSSSRSPSKAILFLFLASLVFASFNLPVIFCKQFLTIKNTIEEKASLILGKDVSVRDIGFLPYGEAILNHITIRDKEKTGYYIEIEKLNIKFNVLELLRRKKIRGFYLKGAAIFTKPDFVGAVKYNLDVVVTPDVISIGNLSLDFTKFIVDIKGNINDYGYRPRLEFSVASKEIDMPGIAKINNLYSYLQFSKDGLSVKSLDFFLNDFPIGLTCKVSDFKSPIVEFTVKSYPGQLASLRPFNPFNFELSFSGKKIGNLLNGDLIVTTQKLISVNPREMYSAMVKIDDLSCGVSNKAVSVKAKRIFCKTTVSGKELSFDAADFRTLAYLGKTKIFLTGLRASAYEGFLHGNGFADLDEWPVKLLLDFKVYGIDIALLAKALGLNYELKGSLDFKGVFNNRRDPCLSGRMDIKSGYLKDLRVLGMISDFLNVPSLKDVYFEAISSMTSVSLVKKEIAFDKVIVSAQDINLNGNMRLKNTKKINGNISVKLSTTLLKESFKLRLLFLLIGEKLRYQDFEFEIGGFVSSPQIKWLSTRFKENIMKFLTEGGRKAMEKSLENATSELLPGN